MVYQKCYICFETLPSNHRKKDATHGYCDGVSNANLYCKERKCRLAGGPTADSPDWQWLNLQKLYNNGLWEHYYKKYAHGWRQRA